MPAVPHQKLLIGSSQHNAGPDLRNLADLNSTESFVISDQKHFEVEFGVIEIN